jgi:hypothetical protein
MLRSKNNKGNNFENSENKVTANNIVKIWCCDNCESEYLERPSFCRRCDWFSFHIKYAGEISNSDELASLVEYAKNLEEGKNK